MWNTTGHVLGPGDDSDKDQARRWVEGSGGEAWEAPWRPPREGARMLCRGTSEPRELGAPHWRSGEQQVGVAGGPAQALG